MDMNLYVAELRLAELREQAARHRLVQAMRLPHRPLRVRLGQALIGLGHQLLTGSQSLPRSMGAHREPC
jgi:hypothetical protein